MKAKDRFILENFWQEGNNCSSIALIKAALVSYGSGIFRKRTERGGDALIITLRNKLKIRLSKKRIKNISRQNEIAFTQGETRGERVKIKRLKKQVNLCFAVLVAYLVKYGNGEDPYTWREAIEELTTEGFYSDEVFKLLGLRNRTKRTNQKLKKADLIRPKHYPIIVYDKDHAVVVHEKYYDNFGDLEPLKDIRDLFQEIRGCYWYRI